MSVFVRQNKLKIRPRLFLFLLAVLLFSACSKNDKESSQSTRHSNVTVISKPFNIEGLNRERQIRVYVPENYVSSDKKYPVLYMHDGQNLFDDATSYSGEWGVDESLNELSMDLIVVGIDNGGDKRMNELSPWENKDFGVAEGKEYVEFIVKQLKPFIDNNYRTLSDRNNTAIMGSSMGGLISHYAIYEHPEIFSKAGIFSPSYWYSDSVFSFTENKNGPKDSRLFLLVGEKEGADVVSNTQKMYAQIIESGHHNAAIKIVIDPEGEHHESFWRKHFSDSVQWLFKQDKAIESNKSLLSLRKNSALKEMHNISSDFSSHWLTENLIFLPKGDKGFNYSLVNSESKESILLVETEYPESLAKTYPHLKDFQAFKVNLSLEKIKQYLKALPYISISDEKAVISKSAYTQTGFVLDDIYTQTDNDADEVSDLGATVTSSGIAFKLWAPTAQSVKVLLFDEFKSTFNVLHFL